MAKLTFKELCRLEPRLRALYKEARAIVDDPSQPCFCANTVWYCDFKPRLFRLVGDEVADPRLRTSEAYDTAYDAVYAALPDCRNCSCL